MLFRSIIFPPPSKQRVSQILRGDTWPDRKTWPRRLAEEGFSFDKIVNQVSNGMAQGENQVEIAKRIRPLVDNVRYRAARIARTEGMRVAGEQQKESWKHVESMTIGIQMVAVLDARTRPEHVERDGTVYLKPGFEYDAEKIEDFSAWPSPPDAPNCRCRGRLLFKSKDEL